MRYLYTFAIRIYVLLIHISALRSPKAMRWIKGRSRYWYPLKAAIPFDKPVVWFHAASLGEFEQGRPVLENFRAGHPHTFIVLTFFSPSGYEVHKNYEHADYITYIPADTPAAAKLFVRILHPEIAFFIKYEFWFNHLRALSSTSCRVILVSGIFRPGQHFFRLWGVWFRKQLGCFTHFFVQDENSARLLQEAGYTDITISGDTRFDRVAGICRNAPSIAEVEAFCANSHVVVGGSTWPEDEKVLKYLYDNLSGIKLVIAPHEVHEKRIQQIEKLFQGECLRLSHFPPQGHNALPGVLIVDSVGLLSGIYRYARLAVIGGGFGKGIHNILEAACFGLPVFFGPNYHKFREAKDLIALGAAFPFTDKAELLQKAKPFGMETDEYKKLSAIASDYVKAKTGAADIIVNYLKKSI